MLYQLRELRGLIYSFGPIPDGGRSEVRILKSEIGISRQELDKVIGEFLKKLFFKQGLISELVPDLGQRMLPYYSLEGGQLAPVALVSVSDEGFATSMLPESEGALTDFIAKKLKVAKYKKLSDGSYFGDISGLKGVWANARSLRNCKKELQEVLEDWLLLKIRDHDRIPGLEIKIHGPSNFRHI